ncbi:uncharacterized protein HMPREF1541_03665 [Cyphellophora europaea CBS 101466]|uniref:DUF6536 domain-containing protein n=1 Tax=Cyphellophora europaea (strain CBS 101466) TaxID=1220924 RepID=W2S182_CYPE1|nr:uncharacterized protein HMPREF1541_03665 [Cyphellophora europaea CBS 101466]ETN41729.1 hypothetical protein HMPREF1541_03665 [Cyphellophora europaea CBS 101466]
MDSGSDHVIVLSERPKADSRLRPNAEATRSRSPIGQSDLGQGGMSMEALISTLQPSRRQFTGWRVGACSAAVIGCLTMVVNVVALRWLKSHPNLETGLVEVYRGDCHQVERLHIWSHFAINLLGTLLLSGSNYCMQVLCAPTRSELDRAHAKRQYLNIGIQSPRNLWLISPYRAIMWWVLGLSSIPLHLVYNSAFYSSIGVSDYRIDLVAPGFVNGEPFEVTDNSFINGITYDRCGTNSTCMAAVENLLANARIETDQKRVQRLDPAACLAAYANPLLTDRSNLVLVTSGEPTGNNSLLVDHHYAFEQAIDLQRTRYEPFDWICHSSERMIPVFGITRSFDKPPCESWVSDIIARSEDWTPYDFDIDHCLSQRIDERCSFNGNISVLTVVIVFNVVKILCMLWVAFGLGRETPLITIGDALASFLHNPDPVTSGCCMWGRKDFIKAIKQISKGATPADAGFVAKPPSTTPGDATDQVSAKPASRKTYRWAEGASRQRWFWTFTFIALALIIVLALFGAGHSQIKKHNTPMSTLGFGKINASALVNGWGVVFMTNSQKQIATAVIVANLPQTILSFLYLHLNSLITSLTLTSETLSYAHAPHKPLRVSLPHTSTPQRSTFFLQLPHHLAFPLMALSGLLHWLVSQSFFLAVVAEYTWDGILHDATAIVTCGFSLLPMLVVVGLGVGILVGVAVAARARGWEAKGMPLAGSCSLAVSALCHGPVGEEGAWCALVRWGVVAPGGEEQAGVGHCSFSSGEVGEVVEGKLYK